MTKTPKFNPLLSKHYLSSVGITAPLTDEQATNLAAARSDTDRLAQLIFQFFATYQVEPCGPLMVTIKPFAHSPDRILIDLRKLEQRINLYFSIDMRSTLRAMDFTAKMVADYVEAHLEDLVFNWSTAELKTKLAHFSNHGSPKGTLIELVKAITGRDVGAPRFDLEVLLDALVLETFMWSVKRKLYGLPVVEHIMPVIAGPLQGSGKSYLVERLFLAPLEKFVQVRSVDFITDERNAKSLSNSLVVFFDEMARIAKADEESLKRVISADVLNYRPMHTNLTAQAIQRNTFIGTSNKSMIDLVKDTTGNRRFYEIPAGNINREVVNRIDYQMLWRQVDEQAECPLYRMIWDGEKEVKALNLVRGLQSEYQHRDTVSLFLEEEFFNSEILLTTDGHRTWSKESTVSSINKARSMMVPVPMTDLYTQYSAYCTEAGYQNGNRYEILTRNKFARALKADHGLYIGRYSGDSAVYVDRVKAEKLMEEEAAQHGNEQEAVQDSKLASFIKRLDRAQETNAKIIALTGKK